MLSLRRDDVTTTRTVVRITNFNPRLREGGDHPNTAPEATTENFNPRLREGGDDIYHAPSCCKKISIHASAKEATLFIDVIHALHVFQSTPPRRRRLIMCLKTRWNSRFQSTPPRRRRHRGYGQWRGQNISIHASAKEATGKLINAGLTLIQFQSTPPRRRRPATMGTTVDKIGFQSTPPRRRRHNSLSIRQKPNNFNPRLREGGDRNIL